jgi:hypothetical protein
MRRRRRFRPSIRGAAALRQRAGRRLGQAAADLKRIYAGQLELAEAIAQSAQMLALAEEAPSALLCFERDPVECHRTLLLDAVAPDVEVTHLFA